MLVIDWNAIRRDLHQNRWNFPLAYLLIIGCRILGMVLFDLHSSGAWLILEFLVYLSAMLGGLFVRFAWYGWITRDRR
jgi:hypothetical protein